MELQKINQNLLPDLLQKQFGSEIFSQIITKQHISVKGSAGSAVSILAAELFLTQNKTILYLADDKEDALYINAEMEDLLGKDNILYFPATHLEPYQIEKTQNANLVLRTEVINKLNSGKSPKVIVAFIGAMSEKVLKKEDFKAISHHIKVRDQLDFDFVDELLNHYQFNQTDFVSEPGEFSVRGGIVDVFSFSNEKPFRITFFGNEVESIRTFDIESQLSLDKIDEFQLVSNMNFSVSGSKVSFFELLPEDSFIVSKNLYLSARRIKEFHEKALEKYETLSKDIKHKSPDELFISEGEFQNKLIKFKTIDFSSQHFNLPKSQIVELNQTQQPSFHKNFELLIQDLEEKQGQGFDTWISFSSEKQKERLQSIFEELQHEIPFKSFKSELHEGFVDSDNKILIYTDHQIFDRYQRYKSKDGFAKSEQLTLKDLMSLKVGDYIAHIDHGIGKFMGLVKVNNDGKIQECFKLSYKNGDLLYVSIHSLHKISKYNGPDGKEIVLSKLGSPAWKSLKQKTKARVKQIAFDLIKLYAERKTAKGFQYSPDSYLQNELEASFLYEDTPDQEKATLDVKKDMENEGVMDRLICGDVGFGKTEVAIRAAFKAATDGKQVAILVPTTILAFQHYRSFKERLKDFPVNISYMNRFRTAKQKSETKEVL
ncbi:CarD family transcriptional regulator, partial [Epilithonimonas hominis]|uniref:CarD family transcriptional regulator n=1 Tax=Epilithonimonas hominis TaxID=420404 RepID=UPI0028B1DDA7